MSNFDTRQKSSRPSGGNGVPPEKEVERQES